MKAMQFNIIGLGNIGLRYIESIRSNDINSKIICYDIDINYKKRLIEFLKKNKLSIENIIFCISISDFFEKINNESVVLITTTAINRKEIIISCAKMNPSLIITEKLVVDSRSIYESLLNSLESIRFKNILVNFFPRNQVFFRDYIKKYIRDKNFKMHINIPNLGLACNGIHFFDLFLSLSNSNKYKILDSFYLKTYSQKREGFFDFSGGIKVESNNCVLSIIDDLSYSSNFISIYCDEDTFHYYMIDEIMIKLNNEKSEVFNFKLNHVSNYIYHEIDSFLKTGKSNLPNIIESLKSHEILFDFIERFKLNNIKIT